MSLGSAVAKNTLIQIIGKAITTVLGILALALMTRYLGQIGFGEYTTIIIFLTFFAVIADFGLTLITSQSLGETKNKTEETKILNNLFTFRLVSIIIFIALALITVLFFPYNQIIKWGILICSLAFVFPALNQIFIGLFQKKLRMDRPVIAEVTGRVLLLIGILISINYKLGLNGILISTIISTFVNFILNYIFASKFIKIRLKFDFSFWKKIFIKSWPLAVSIILNLIYLRADILILSLFKSINDVALYGAAYRIIDVLTTVPFMFAGIILPILTIAWIDKKKTSFNKILQKSFNFMAIIAIPLVVGSQFLSDPLMTLVAGHDFSASGLILKILIFSVAAIFLGTIFSHAIIALNKQKAMLKFYAFTSSTSLIGYLIFIPKYSYIGAAWVTVYSELLIAIFAIYYVFKTSRFFPKLNVVWKALLSSVIMGLLLYFIPAHYQQTLGGLTLIFSSAVIIYFLCLYVLKGINYKDLKLFSNKI